MCVSDNELDTKNLSFEIYNREVYWKSADVSKEFVISIFSVKELAKKETSMKQAVNKVNSLSEVRIIRNSSCENIEILWTGYT
jgi:inner membrane protein involved in colicin E2 resistance